MNRFSRNVAAIVRRYPRFTSEVLDRFSPATIEFAEARNGEPTGSLDGIPLHSRRNPGLEAARTVNTGVPDHLVGCVCLGFGLGYYLRATYQAFPEIPIIVIEPDPARFLAGLGSLDLAEVLSDPRVSLLISADASDIAGIIAGIPPGEIHIVSPRSLRRQHEEYYAAVDDRLNRLIERRRINRNTLARFGSRWIRNLSANLPVMARARGVSLLESALAGMPALVLAAGPSLDDVLPDLPHLALRSVIIAVDTNLRACLSAGVVPDFVVVVDPQYWNARHLDRCETEQTILVSESSSHPSVFYRRYRDILFCGSLFPLGNYLEQSLGSFGKLGAGGSVATTGWDFARYLGCAPIYTAGLDLGYPDGKTHTKGSTFEERAHLLSRRCVPAEHAAFLALHDASPHPVAANDGGTVLTDRRLFIYRFWFENQLETAPDTVARNLSRRGVRIEGMEPATLDEVLKLPVTRDEISRRICVALGSGSEDRSTELSRSVSALIAEIELLAALARRALTIVEGIDTERVVGPAVLSALDTIDGRIRESAGKEIVGFVLQETIEEVTSVASASIGRTEVWAKSRVLYSRLVEACELHISSLSRGKRFLDQGFGKPVRDYS